MRRTTLVRWFLFFCCVGIFAVIIGLFIHLKTQQHTPSFIQPITEINSLFLHENLTTPKPIIYGYMPYWTVKTAQIPPILSAISFFSIPIHTDGTLLAPRKPVDYGYSLFKRGILTSIRARSQPGQKIELTLTMLGQDDIRTFMSDPQSFLRLEQDCVALLSQSAIDGLNIDIEYVDDFTVSQQAYVTNGLQELSMLLRSRFPKLHLSIAVLSDAVAANRLTDIRALAPYFDHFIVMTYDFHHRSSMRSGPNSPMYSGQNSGANDIMSTLKGYTDFVSPSKLLLGIPFYGYEWSVTDQAPQSFTLPHTGKTDTYERIQQLIATKKTSRQWDPVSLTPFIVYLDDNLARHQVYYEDPQSIAYKLQIVQQAHLGGIAIWALGFEGNDTSLWQAIEKGLH